MRRVRIMGRLTGAHLELVSATAAATMDADEEIDVSQLAAARGSDTELLSSAPGSLAVRRFSLTLDEGPGIGRSWQSSGDKLTVGSHPANTVSIDDAALSRFHCELCVESSGVWVRDLDSSNGTVVDGVRVRDAAIRDGSIISCGRSRLRFQLAESHTAVSLSDRTRFGSLVGESVAMRATFALLERVAPSDATVLLTGETGTGKERAAESIHTASRRADGPFLVLDCGAIPASLLESELFGHERGAFTGATERRAGIFEEADGGTVFLDEIGELPVELQPKLLRVLESKTIRRIGSNAQRSVDVRLIAATHRDLRELVNSGAFRSDLYFRLAVIEISLPALRRRPEDIPALVEHFADQLDADAAARERLADPALLAQLRRAAWPGNVRELRNAIERCIVMEQAPSATSAPGDGFVVDPSEPYSAAKRRVLDEFERRYLTSLLALHGGNVSKAAREAGMDRVYVYKLLRKHDIRR